MKHLFVVMSICASLACLAEDAVTHRRNFRAWLEREPEVALAAGLADADAVIRRFAVYQDFLRNGPDAVLGWQGLVDDPDEQVQLAVVECLGKLPAENFHRKVLGQRLKGVSKFKEVVRLAAQLEVPPFNYYRENVRLKDDPTFDHNAEIKEKLPLADDNWLFCLDKAGDGHVHRWFDVDLNESAWRPIKVGAWEQQGYPNYDGLAWYRIRFTAPPRDDCVGAELYFGSVDEQAWVWLNGKYVGQHAIGPDGWDIDFWLNIGDEINWGAENLLVVRVEDSAKAGGIWKPIELQTLLSK